MDLVRHAANEGETAKMHRNCPAPGCPVGREIRNVLVDVYATANAAMDRELAGISLATLLSEVMEKQPVVTQ